MTIPTSSDTSLLTKLHITVFLRTILHFTRPMQWLGEIEKSRVATSLQVLELLTLRKLNKGCFQTKNGGEWGYNSQMAGSTILYSPLNLTFCCLKDLLALTQRPARFHSKFEPISWYYCTFALETKLKIESNDFMISFKFFQISHSWFNISFISG